MHPVEIPALDVFGAWAAAEKSRVFSANQVPEMGFGAVAAQRLNSSTP